MWAKSTAFEISVEKRDKENIYAKTDEKAFLILDHFTQPPKLEFGRSAVSIKLQILLHI